MTAQPVFIRCRRCNQLCRLSSPLSPTSPEASDEGRGNPAGKAGHLLFLTRHDGHPLEALALVAEPQLLIDQSGTHSSRVLLEVTNGNERLLVEGRRQAGNTHGLEFRVVTAEDISSSGRRVKLDAEAMRREIDRLFYPQVVPAGRVERYMEALAALMVGPAQENFEFSLSASGGVVIRPRARTITAFRRAARDIFPDPEYHVISQLIKVIERGEPTSPLKVVAEDQVSQAG